MNPVLGVAFPPRGRWPRRPDGDLVGRIGPDYAIFSQNLVLLDDSSGPGYKIANLRGVHHGGTMLEALGLSSKASETYQAIVANPRLSAAELAELLDWPIEELHIALDELADLALVRPSWEHPETLLAVSPAVGFASLLAREESDLLRRQEVIASTRSEVMLLVKQYSQNYRLQRPSIEQLAGLDSTRSRIEELASDCKTEMMAFAPGGAQKPDVMAASRQPDLVVLQRGVRMRTIYVQGIYNDPDSLSYAQWLSEMGASIRVAPALSFRMIIYDQRRALVPVDPDDEALGAMLFTGTGVVKALCENFEQMWRSATPLSATRPRRPVSGLTEQQRTVLRMLADGYTDEATARRLGVSIRTVRRITAELMTLLGARSRFQAGIYAAQSRLLGSEFDSE
jgi:DNA-binding CsgD family transcriptional regulator/sugar-specific transcriptional regulator TrmB